MIEFTILSLTFGFGFLTGAVLAVIAMLKPLRKAQLDLEACKVVMTPDQECRINAPEY